MERNGIAIAGNICVDYVKQIPTYPKAGMLTNIGSAERAVGGCVPNVAISLARMGKEIPISGVGCVGKDDMGGFTVQTMQADGIDTRMISRIDTATSYTDVMNACDTGERTFFHYRGANAVFSPAHVDLDALTCKMLHIGYLLLLDTFDGKDSQYGTVMARFLHDAQQKGIKTSIDCVSDSTGVFSSVVKPALPYCDNVIVNEIEGCSVWNLSARDEKGQLNEASIRDALTAFKQAGVKERVVIHCPEAGFCMDRDGRFVKIPSLRLPEGYIKGSVGAGDAFCAGCLRSIYLDRSSEEMLTLGAAAAAANLSEADSISGMKPEAELLKLAEAYKK